MEYTNNLNEMLEKILFNEKDLNKLKIAIDQLNLGELTPKDLRKGIIESRAKIIEELVKFFPFYLKQLNINKSLEEFREPHKDKKLEQELQEKNKFLEEVGSRVKRIHEKLLEKMAI